MCAPRTAPPAPQQPEQGVRVHGRRRAHLRHHLNNPVPLTRNHIPCGGFSCTVDEGGVLYTMRRLQCQA